jgi:flavin-dependent dehydrogenase
MNEVKILGAGLSGLTAAINLAKPGHKVDVYEKNENVGMRFHGDLQGLENWSEKKDILEELKKMNVDANFDCTPFHSVILTNGSKAKEISFKQPLFYLVKRGPFLGTIDYSLKMQALKSGVNIHFQKKLPKNEVNIVATGPTSNEITEIVKGIIFRTDSKDIAIGVVNDELAFKRYSYFLVTKGYGCICTIVQRDEVCRISRYFDKTKEFFVNKLNLQIQPIREFGGVGSVSMKKVKKGATLYVGEAAGLQDFLWGFGMRFAITSGYLAAQSIISNKDYEKIAEMRFGKQLRAGIVNRYLWENVLSKKGYSLSITFSEFLKKSIYSMHNYNLFQRLVYPIALFDLKTKYPEIKL